MKKIICYIIAVVMILCLFVVPVFATEAESGEVITEEVSHTSEEPIETEGPSGTPVSTEFKEETLIQTESETEDIGALVMSEFGADPQFWAVVILCAVMTVALIFETFVLLAKVNPTSRKSMNGMATAIEVVENIKKENSQTLEKMLEDNTLWKEKVIELEDKLSRVESLEVKEKHDLFMALFNDLRIHKLVCDRLAMPVNDKSIIDLWYTQGMEAIKDDMSEEDLAFINRISEKLNGVGKKK